MGGVKKQLSNALGSDSTALRLAGEIEEILFTTLSSEKGGPYQRQARSIVFNLKAADGSEFRDTIRNGTMPLAALPSLPSECMASAAKKAERQEIRREAMEACESDWHLRHDEEKLNGAFTCGKCGGNQPWYFQFQTRACDEPMEFFVMCRECRHGGRHNDVSPDDIFRQVWSS